MYDILTLNAISDKIYTVLDKNYTVSKDCPSPDGILVRSFNMADYEAQDNLLAVARAGAGVNNIPLPQMTEDGVVVFNTPGANANAVKELVICALFLASRGITNGINWASTLAGKGADVPKLVEKGKSQFAGIEILGKTLGVIGLGAIGVKVALAAKGLGMTVIGYDPFISDYAKTTLAAADITVSALETIYASSDFITLHVPLLDSTRSMINASALASAKDGVSVLNFSRAELVDLAAVKNAIQTKKMRNYIVDFPTDDALNQDGIIALPHLGASTEEAEDNCAIMASQQLKDYLENGNIKNSVNFPAISVARTLKYRITATYNTSKGVPEALNAIASKNKATLNFAERNTIGFAIIDTDNEALASIDQDGSIIAELEKIPEIFAVRIL